MSRIIKHDSPLTESDIKYLQTRGRHAEIERNRKKFADAKPKEPAKDSAPKEEKPAPEVQGGQKLHLDEDLFEKVKAMSPNDLRAELRKVKIAPPKSEREMRIKLAQHLQEERDAS